MANFYPTSSFTDRSVSIVSATEHCFCTQVFLFLCWDMRHATRIVSSVTPPPSSLKSPLSPITLSNPSGHGRGVLNLTFTGLGNYNRAACVPDSRCLSLGLCLLVWTANPNWSER